MPCTCIALLCNISSCVFLNYNCRKWTSPEHIWLTELFADPFSWLFLVVSICSFLAQDHVPCHLKKMHSFDENFMSPNIDTMSFISCDSSQERISSDHLGASCYGLCGAPGGSWVLKASAVECWSIPFIGHQLTLNQNLDWHLIDISIDTRLTPSWHTVNWMLTDSYVLIQMLLTEISIKCE